MNFAGLADTLGMDKVFRAPFGIKLVLLGTLVDVQQSPEN